MSEKHGLTSIEVRAGHPDFLDLPWHLPLIRWREGTDRIVELERGLSRHVIQFASYEGRIYAFKELSPRGAEREYQILRGLEDRRLPAVVPAGHARARIEGEDGAKISVLITRYLDYSQPYRALFMSPRRSRDVDRLLDAMADLLVQLHVAGFYWGDCSLSNTLFLRDANALQAHLVDAETSEFPERFTDGHREQDLMVMRENVTGELFNANAVAPLPDGISVQNTGASISDRYHALWNEITRVETISQNESYKIHKSIARVLSLGFSVSAVDLKRTEDGSQLRLRPIVTDRDYHANQLQGLTGISAGQHQAALMLNEIHEVRASMEREAGHEVAISAAAYRWLQERFHYAMQRLGALVDKLERGPEIYCQLLEHKWLLSERAGHDVGLDAAIDDYMRRHRAA